MVTSWVASSAEQTVRKKWLETSPRLLLALAVLISAPNKTEQTQFRNLKKQLRVSIPKASPPRALNEDLSISPVIVDFNPEARVKPGSVRLEAGASVGTDPSRLIKSWAQISRAEVVAAHESQIRKISRILISKADLENKAIRLAQAPEPIAASAPMPQPESRSGFIQQLPPHLRLRAQKIQSLDTILNSDWSQPTVQGAIVEATTKPTPASGESYRVATNQTQPGNSRRGLTDDLTRSQRGDQSSIASEVVITGHIEMGGGLAYTGSDNRIQIFHKVGLHNLAEGEVSVQRGDYRISIREPLGGMLVGELRDGRGRLLGRGEVPLISPTRTSPGGDLKIVLKPVIRGLRGQVVSAYSVGSYQAPSVRARISIPEVGIQQVTSPRGGFEVDQVGPGSTFKIRAKANQHLPTVQLASSDRDPAVTVVPQKMVDALSSLVDVAPKANGGVIWGKVTSRGQNLGGVSLDLDNPKGAVGPIYFNAFFLPDKNLDSTSENGLFAFLDVTPGAHQVRARRGSAELPSRVVPVEAGAASPIDIVAGGTQIAKVNLRDFLTGLSTDGQVGFLGGNRYLQTKNGAARLKYSGGTDPLFLETIGDPRSLPSRLVSSRTISEVEIPIVKYEWFEEAMRVLRINPTGEQTIATGRFDSEFRIFVDEESMKAGARLIYFNKENRFLPDAQVGPAGGGFALINAPQGLRTLIIQFSSQDEPITRLFFSEPGVASVF